MNELIIVLAGWRICSLLMWEEGPFNILGKTRELLKIKRNDYEIEEETEGFLSKLFECIFCFSMYSGSISILIAGSIFPWILWPFAASTGIIIIDKVINYLESNHGLPDT